MGAVLAIAGPFITGEEGDTPPPAVGAIADSRLGVLARPLRGRPGEDTPMYGCIGRRTEETRGGDLAPGKGEASIVLLVKKGRGTALLLSLLSAER